MKPKYYRRLRDINGVISDIVYRVTKNKVEYICLVDNGGRKLDERFWMVSVEYYNEMQLRHDDLVKSISEQELVLLLWKVQK